MFFKVGVLKNFAIFTEKHASESLFNLKKKTPAQVFSCEYCKISMGSVIDKSLRKC